MLDIVKVAFVTGSVSRKAGGLEAGVRRLAQSLVSCGARVETFALRDEHTTTDSSKWAPLPLQVFPVRGPSEFGFAPGLSDALMRSKAGLLMSHGLWMYPSMATNRWHAKTGGPYIVHPHGMLDGWALRNSQIKKKLAGLLYENAHLQKAACIRALCESEAQCIRAYGLRNPICVVPNGVDLPIGEPPAESAHRLSVSGRKVLLYLGRLHLKKGLRHLLRAWALLQNSQPLSRESQVGQWVLAIAGWDQNGHEAELKGLATELGLHWADVREKAVEDFQRKSPDRGSRPHAGECADDSQLVFLGPRFEEAKRACYRNCDAFILPSFSEGLPMVVLEAWAHGKPVIMTPECNLAEGFAAGAALRTRPAVPDLTNALRHLFGLSRSELVEMGARGKELARCRFAWNRIANEMNQVSEWVLGGGPAPSCVFQCK